MLPINSYRNSIVLTHDAFNNLEALVKFPMNPLLFLIAVLRSLDRSYNEYSYFILS